MSRESSPRPMSDDSAIGSMASMLNCNGTNSNNHTSNESTTPRTYARSHLQNLNQQNNTNTPTSEKQQQQQQQPQQNNPNNHQRQTTNLSATSLSTSSSAANGFLETQDSDNNSKSRVLVRPEELRMVSAQMRYNNTTMLSRSIRTNLSCFDDLDMDRLEFPSDYLVNFKSIGINKSPYSIHRPVSILWPDSYDSMIDELSKLDAMLINTEYKEKPIEWMLKYGLTTTPKCRICQNQMTLNYDRKNVSWRCQQTQPCQNLYAPIQRPIFFKGYENVGLMKLLFAIYYWSICTPSDLLHSHLKLEPQVLHDISRSLQNVCRVALEKSYPRFRLCNDPARNDETLLREPGELIDLVSIRLNNCYVVCAKHPQSNCVRLGLRIPKVSEYSFAELTESWFASGARIRVCESKFLDLMKRRSDLKVNMVSRSEMVTKNGTFNRDSAFGYLICQLTHTLKDFDSNSLQRETLKLILAEMEWRELFGTNPHDAFTKIVEHMASYKGATGHHHEFTWDPSESAQSEENTRDLEYVFAERYFYAVMHPIDAAGKIIQRYGAKPSLFENPIPVVQFRCHFCKSQFESLHFSMHMIAHVEKNRRENEEAEFLQTKHVKCKHCFKKLKKSALLQHSRLFRTDLQRVKFGCRICCIEFPDRLRFLEHMRRTHFEHEMPYRCPSCKFASSFQRDLIIHFQEEHQTDYVIWCPFCSRSYTIADPTKLDSKKVLEVSKVIYNHFLEHYSVADSYACDSCCLSFLSRDKLDRHKALHHNPLEMMPETGVHVQPFIVARQEEPFCVQALQMELFIPNKRPSVPIDEVSQAIASTSGYAHPEVGQKRPNNRTSVVSMQSKTFSQASESSSSSDDSSDDENGSDLAAFEKGAIHVRSANITKRFLQGGEAALHLPKTKPNVDLSTEKIIEYFSKLERADCIIPNQSVILTPSGRPARCVECLEYITVDHYVAAIPCKLCKYATHCPLAATKHKQKKHTDDNS